MTKREKVLLVVFVIVLILAGAYSAYAFRDELFTKKTKVTPIANVTSNKNLNSNKNKNLNANENSNSDATKVTPIVDKGVTWLSASEMENQDLFSAGSFPGDVNDIKYYKIGILDTGDEIVMAKGTCDMNSVCLFRFLKDQTGKFNYLSKHSYETDPNIAAKFLKDLNGRTSIGYSRIFASISSPDAINTENNINLRKGWQENLFSNLNNSTKVAETNYGVVYETFDGPAAGSSVKMRSLYLKHADSTVTMYSLVVPFASDDQVPNVTLDGAKNGDKYFKSIVSAKCGATGGNTSVVAEKQNFQDRLSAAGITNDGDKVYYPKDSNDSLLKEAYETYKVGRESDLISYDDFFAKKPIFIWKDPFGEYITFFNQNYAPLTECGKPVIYLYPKEPTSISVKVDASITKSEPTYGDGWNVFADPSGKLTVDGKAYDSLFWEGKGKIYPNLNSGFMVERAAIKTTLIEHLAKLGLSEKERNDFLEFWLPKMPTTPYTRLTWFGTKDMDKLAPLKVDPAPDTVIRVFLDFEGLEGPVEINPQQLYAPKREGFTLIEWGGVLVGGAK